MIKVLLFKSLHLWPNMTILGFPLHRGELCDPKWWPKMGYFSNFSRLIQKQRIKSKRLSYKSYGAWNFASNAWNEYHYDVFWCSSTITSSFQSCNDFSTLEKFDYFLKNDTLNQKSGLNQSFKITFKFFSFIWVVFFLTELEQLFIDVIIVHHHDFL